MEIFDKSKEKNEIKDEVQIEVIEVYKGHRPIPIKIANKVMKAICKIIIRTKKLTNYGTGFFLNFSDSLKYLLTKIINLLKD